VAGEELIKYKGWQVRSSSNTMAGRWEAHQIQGMADEKLIIKYKAW
jgi:hypothetical protein